MDDKHDKATERLCDVELDKRLQKNLDSAEMTAAFMSDVLAVVHREIEKSDGDSHTVTIGVDVDGKE